MDGKKDKSNWLKYVNCARHGGEQNMTVVQSGQEIFYETYKDIPRGAELLVWYGTVYSQFMGLPLGLHSQSPHHEQPRTPDSEESDVSGMFRSRLKEHCI